MNNRKRLKQNYRVLIADADADTRSALAQMVHRMLPMATVRLVTDGAAALLAYDTHGADIVITAYRLQRLHGLALIGLLRVRSLQLAILMVSGHPNIQDQAFQAGANTFLAKPLTYNQLVGALTDLLGSVHHEA